MIEYWATILRISIACIVSVKAGQLKKACYANLEEIIQKSLKTGFAKDKAAPPHKLLPMRGI